ncbi:IS701 family transposase [Saccharopolyspora hattusasensis]|uniref:IS701 family transposase n=1 Tax=Saccharopolyspora hattusasensis TaxID=1128679 RepID=UPI003D962FEA
MLPAGTVLASLLSVLEGVRLVFTAPTFITFTQLVTGLLAATGPRTVTGMWGAAGLAGVSHHARAHRFFSDARWSPDALGLALARLVVARLVDDGRPLRVGIDDTLFHRYGSKTHGVFWQHDGSAKGRDGIGRGNCFVVAGLIVTLPFMARQVCLPVLFRLYIPKNKSGISKPDLARELVGLVAAAFPGRQIDVVVDAAYRGPAWRTPFPAKVTFTTRLASNAVLYGPRPPRTGRRGRPRLKGDRLGTPADLAATATWRRTRVRRYGSTDTVLIAVIPCLWWGSLYTTPVVVVLVKTPDSTKPYDIAVVSTDTTATGEALIARYADRWSIEQTIKDCKTLLGTGETANRVPAAVQRSVPFTMLGLTILILWYAQHGNAVTDLAIAHAGRPWYRRKTHISIDDMLIAFRRARITTISAGHNTPDQNPTSPPTSTPTAA